MNARLCISSASPGSGRHFEYPWLLALAALAVLFFDPTKAPYFGSFRVIVAVRDVVLIAAAVLFVTQSTHRADELERRIHLEALAWSYTAVIIALLIQAMAADLLPPTAGYLGCKCITHGMGCLLACHLDTVPKLKNRVPELRAERGWSQAGLAERLGVSRQTVNAIETERYDPSLPLAFVISRVFRLPIESIFKPDTRSRKANGPE